MPSALENLDRWSRHKWAQQGDEWSPGRSAEGSATLWYRTIFPRIQRYVPNGTILEIGPGFGRWTQFLRNLCNRLMVVDLVDRCVESCRQRFAGDRRIEYFVNDGVSLEMIPDRSIDFIFSFDSLVHAEADSVGAYLAQAARKLKPGGAGFIHHSNLAAFVNPRTGHVRRFVTKRNWRPESMSADVFRRQCDAAGLTCRSQELINWIGRGRQVDRHRLDGRLIPLTDCLSVFTTFSRNAPRPTLVANHDFVEEWRQAVWIADVYAKDELRVDDVAAGRPGAHPFVRKLATARKLLRDRGAASVGALAWDKATAAGEFTMSALKARLLGEANRWFARRSLTR